MQSQPHYLDAMRDLGLQHQVLLHCVFNPNRLAGSNVTSFTQLPSVRATRNEAHVVPKFSQCSIREVVSCSVYAQSHCASHRLSI
jgi:hypothetical protein